MSQCVQFKIYYLQKQHEADCIFSLWHCTYVSECVFSHIYMFPFHKFVGWMPCTYSIFIHTGDFLKACLELHFDVNSNICCIQVPSDIQGPSDFLSDFLWDCKILSTELMLCLNWDVVFPFSCRTKMYNVSPLHQKLLPKYEQFPVLGIVYLFWMELINECYPPRNQLCFWKENPHSFFT